MTLTCKLGLLASYLALSAIANCALFLPHPIRRVSPCTRSGHADKIDLC
jgi:hypothetical protein